MNRNIKPTNTTSCTALVLIDKEPVKKKLIKLLDRAKRTLAKNKDRWDLYCNVDKPEFDSWLHSTFGSIISKLKALQEKITEQHFIVARIAYFSHVLQRSEKNIYLEWLEQVEKGLPHMEAFSLFEQEAAVLKKGSQGNFQSADGSEQSEKDPTDCTDDFQNFYNARWEQETPSNKMDIHPQKQKIRDIYRNLCSKLHPDTGCEFNDDNSRLWHDIQEAYQAGDLERLEVIQAKLNADIDPYSAHISCSEIVALINDTKKVNKSIQKLIRKAECSNNAWGFHYLKKIKVRIRFFTQKIQQDLEKEQAAMEGCLDVFETGFAQWRREGKDQPDISLDLPLDLELDIQLHDPFEQPQHSQRNKAKKSNTNGADEIGDNIVFGF